MKQVYIAEDNISAQMVKDYLASRHIDSIIKGEMLIGAIGELPANSFPTVWVTDENDYDKAVDFIKSYEAGFVDEQVFDNVWKCGNCDELIDAQFTQCWKCGQERKD